MLGPAQKKGEKFRNPVETKVGGLGMVPKILRLYLTNREERTPRMSLGPFSTDASIYQQPPTSGLRITWMGHSSMLVEIDGYNVLIDPVWDEYASPVTWAGPKRFFPAPLPLYQLPLIDVVLISHDHYDHLGKQTIQELATLPAANNAIWVTSLGVAQRLRSFGVEHEIRELNWTETTQLNANSNSALQITALPARHFSGRGVRDRFSTLWSSFALRGSQHNVYFGADTGLWNGLAQIGAEYGPFDLTMLEIGAYNELWKSIHLGPDGAAEAFIAMGGAGLLMPIHWGLFELALHGWRQPIDRLTYLADIRRFPLWAPAPGVPTEVMLGQEHRSDWWITQPRVPASREDQEVVREMKWHESELTNHRIGWMITFHSVLMAAAAFAWDKNLSLLIGLSIFGLVISLSSGVGLWLGGQGSKNLTEWWKNYGPSDDSAPPLDGIDAQAGSVNPLQSFLLLVFGWAFPWKFWPVLSVAGWLVFLGFVSYHARENQAPSQTQVPSATRPLFDRQLALYTEVVQLTSTLATSEDPKELALAEKRFWKLYWGELVLVENQQVKSAVDDFARSLKQQAVKKKPQSRDPLKALSFQVAVACRKSLAESSAQKRLQDPLTGTPAIQ